MTEPALVALRCLDLTSLKDDDSDTSVDQLARRADTPFGAPAALCVWPAFVPTARRTLDAQGQHGVRVATVVNFPQGDAAPDEVARQIDDALDKGADEIDAVLPWRALRAGDTQAAHALVRACRRACGERPLKLILETGELRDAALVRTASEISLAEGADFLKTSTGKVKVNATPEAVAVMLEVLRAHGGNKGLKIAGGVGTVADVQRYLSQVRAALGDEALAPGRLRFGASSLLPVLLAALRGEAGSSPAKEGSY